jgi:hypothetical protein
MGRLGAELKVLHRQAGLTGLNLRTGCCCRKRSSSHRLRDKPEPPVGVSSVAEALVEANPDLGPAEVLLERL